MKLTVILVDGDFRIHAPGCRDIGRDHAQSETGAWEIEATDRHDANVQCWGDVSSDKHLEGTPEWHAECDRNASAASRYLPCAEALLTSTETTS